MPHDHYSECFPSEDRLRNMRSGAKEFLLWLRDIFRQGLLSLERDPSRLERIAQRMVDYKNGSMARRIRMMRDRIEEDPDWPWYVLDECAELYLLARALENESLSPLQQLDALQAAGYSIRKSQLPDPERYTGQVLHIQFEQYERLKARKVFLAIDETPWYALVLDFVYGGGDFEQYWKEGDWHELKASFYPSAWPVRLNVFDRKKLNSQDSVDFHSCKDWSEVADFTRKRMGKHPWQDEWPFVMDGVQLARVEERGWSLVDRQGNHLSSVQFGTGDELLWRLLAFSVGEPFSVFCISTEHQTEVLNVRKTREQWSPVSI